MKQELSKLYNEYCSVVNDDDNHGTDHEYYRNSLSHFMHWLEKGFIQW